MFGDRFTRKNVVNTSGNTVVANRLNQGCRVEGNLFADTDIRIDGSINGDIICSSRVVIGQVGEVTGNLECADLTIEGKVQGNINCSGTLYFRKSAYFEGEVRFVKLIVEDGADIRASLTRISQNGISDGVKE
jgi:cytoskeletal protein CcmA (bactofilin family)